MKIIKLKSIRCQNPLFFGGSSPTALSDDITGGPAVELTFDPETELVTARRRKDGATCLVPRDNVCSMIPIEQGEPDEVAPTPIDSRIIPEKEKGKFEDTRLQESRAFLESNKPRGAAPAKKLGKKA